MRPLMLWWLYFMFLNSGHIADIFSLDFPSVNKDWIHSVLLNTFGSNRHHLNGRGNKTTAKEFIANHFGNLSLIVHYDEFVSENEKRPIGVNIIGILPGIDRNDSVDTVYMVGAYYDTGESSQGIFDNGAGVVAMLEAARLLVQSGRKKNTLLFVAFDLHALDDVNYRTYGDPDFERDRCCQGAKHFVNTWLPNFLKERDKKYRKVQFGGVILLESILNYDTTPGSTRLKLFEDSVHFMMLFKDLITGIMADGSRGDFLLVIARYKDSKLQEPFITIWEDFRNLIAKIRLLQYNLVFSNDAVIKTIEENVMMTDSIAFYEKNYNGIVITDMGKYRGQMQCDWHCKSQKQYVNDEKILFVVKTTGTLILTLELLAVGNMSDVIHAQIQKTGHAITTTSPKAEESSEQSCSKTDYYYDEKVNMYYKKYTGILEKVTWVRAKTICEDEGAQLLILRNRKMLDFAVRISDVFVWIGMSDEDNEGDWKWVDRTNVTINFWGECQPDDSGIGEDCGLFDIHIQKVIDVSCNNFFSFICVCSDNETVSLEEDPREEDCFVDGYKFTKNPQMYYKIFDKALKHDDAKRTCQNDKTELLPISTLYEYWYINKIIDELDDKVYFIQSDKTMYQYLKQADVNMPLDVNTCYVLVVNGTTVSVNYRDCSDTFPFICGTHCKKENFISNRKWSIDYKQSEFKTKEMLATTDTSIKHFIMKSAIDLSLIKEITTNEPIYSLDIHYMKALLFWHSRKSTFIMMTSLNDTSNTHQRFALTGDPYTYLAVDWLLDNIYYTTTTLQTISVSNGKISKILYNKDVKRPTSIHVEPTNGILLWIEPSGIMCGLMDGQGKERILNGKFNQIAYGFNRLYAIHGNYITKYETNTDAFGPKRLGQLLDKDVLKSMKCFNLQISSEATDIKLDSNGFADIFLVNKNSVVDMKFVIGHEEPSELYLQYVHHLKENLKHVKLLEKPDESLKHNTLSTFCDKYRAYIIWCKQEQRLINDLQTCSKLRLRKYSNPMDYEMFNCVCPVDGVFVTLKNGSCAANICFEDNGKCSQQCNDLDYYPYSFCSCYEGFQLMLDGKTCIPEDDIQQILIFSDATTLQMYLAQGEFKDRTNIVIDDVESYEFAAIEFDPEELKIYWIQDKDFGIKRASINGTGMEEIYPGVSIELRGLILDVFEKRLLMSVPLNSSIVSINTNGKALRKELQLSTDYYASSLSLDTFNGFIYFHKQNKFKLSENGIFRINVENNHLEEILSRIDGPVVLQSFAVDHKAGIIFWLTGAYKEHIKKHQIQGTEGKHVVFEGQYISYTNILLLGDYLYTLGLTNVGILGRIHIEDEVGHIFVWNNHQFNAIGGGYFKQKQQKDLQNTESCNEMSRCLGASMEWICLSSEQICDGSDHCYGSYDEMHCEYREHQNIYTEVELACTNNLPPQHYVYDKQDLTFVNWETHLFSRFIRLDKKESLLTRCSVKYGIVDTIDLSHQTFFLSSFNVYHRFRQIIKSKILRGRHQYIRKLVLSGQGISQTWSNKTFNDFRDLQTLEISNIVLLKLENGVFINLSQLKNLWIRVQSLEQIEKGAFIGVIECQNLTISGTSIQELDPQTFNNLSNVMRLDISQNKLTVIDKELFISMTSLQILDTRGNDIHILGKIFETNVNLELIYSDTYALCCVKPEHRRVDCVAPEMDVSSCDNLIENNVLRIFLWIIGILALFGNAGVLIYRLKQTKSLYQDTFSVLVGNLTVADALIGVYLISVGTADLLFRGEYIWRDYRWRKSLLCSCLGIISIVSSEVSVITISIVTIARYLAVKFPFKEYKISRKNAVVGCVFAWMISFVFALVPYFAFENYYSVSGVCVTLPLRKESTVGWFYSFSLFVVFNFIIFLFIAIAQIPIVYEVKQISARVQRSGDSKYLEVAKRLSLVVATDCFCWIPIGTMGIMAIFGYDMPRTIYAWTVVFILPINSAINPFLYTFIDSVTLERAMKLLKKALKAINKNLLEIMGMLAVGCVLSMIIKILFFINNSKEYFQIYDQLYQEAVKKQQIVKELALERTSLELKLRYQNENATNENCHKMLKENGIGYCCVDWSDLEAGCFVIISEKRNWYDSEIICRQYGHLATVDNTKTSTFLKSVLLHSDKSATAWIGLYSRSNTNEYRWLETNAVYPYNNIKDLSDPENCADLEGPSICGSRKGSVCQIDFGTRRKYVAVSLCPHGWFQIKRSCFWFSGFKMPWREANEVCKLYDNAYLATIASSEINELLQPLLRKMVKDYGQYSFWIGLHRVDDSQDWRWIKTGQIANYTNWNTGEPHSETSFAVYQSSIDGFRWTGTKLVLTNLMALEQTPELRYFICEKELYVFYKSNL